MTAIDITALTEEQKKQIAANFAAEEKAKKEKKDYFTYDGKVILTSYAKYLLEYLKKRIKW